MTAPLRNAFCPNVRFSRYRKMLRYGRGNCGLAGWRRRRFGRPLKKRPHGLRRLCTMFQPMTHLFHVQLDGWRVCSGVVITQYLNKSSIPRLSPLRNYHSVIGLFLCTHPCQSNPKQDSPQVKKALITAHLGT